MGPTIGIIIVVWLFGSLFWGSLCKVIAGNRGLNERRSYWIGFMVWVIGLIIVLAARPEQAAQPGGPPRSDHVSPPPAPSLSIADELAKLAELRDAGELTVEQFEAQRTKLLG